MSNTDKQEIVVDPCQLETQADITTRQKYQKGSKQLPLRIRTGDGRRSTAELLLSLNSPTLATVI